jgi:hypothetical protein
VCACVCTVLVLFGGAEEGNTSAAHHASQHTANQDRLVVVTRGEVQDVVLIQETCWSAPTQNTAKHRGPPCGARAGEQPATTARQIRDAHRLTRQEKDAGCVRESPSNCGFLMVFANRRRRCLTLVYYFGFFEKRRSVDREQRHCLGVE